MTQVATPASSRASFDRVRVEDVHGSPMQLNRRGTALWAEFDDPDATDASASRPRIERPVVMITGSHHQQIFWYPSGQGRLLGQLPGAYLIKEQRWIPRRMAVLHPPSDPVFSETGHWNSTCIACHATHGKPQADTAAEFGIACESCHGPGEAHARANRNPFRRYGLHFAGPPDPTIVQPATLSADRSSQVCGQCHGIWEFYDDAGERSANAGGLPYRPGDELRTTRFVAQPTVNGNSTFMQALVSDDPGFIRDSFWADGMVRVSGREYNGLLESPCFKNAPPHGRAASCLSCHTMHQPAADQRPAAEWADDQLTTGLNGDRACVQCHEPLGVNITAHTRHAPGSSGSACYNCHMPYTTYGLMKAIRSHTISSPSARESVETGRPNACNLCHLDKTLAWTADALAEWFGTPRVSLDADQQSTAASLLWLLQGDAGQRALAAEAMAWPPAQQTSGTGWMAPHLATLLADSYDAVRFIASRSLRTLPGFSDFRYDFVAPPPVRHRAQLTAMTVWDRSGSGRRRPDQALLMDPDGNVRVDAVLRLLKMQDTRRVLLRE